MNANTELQYAKLDELYLDAKNSRLDHHQTNTNLSQEDILDMMSDWDLYELAVSYLENGFWQHEALLVVEEELEGQHCLVVIDGNRRLAALIYLQRAISGKQVSKKWSSLVENRDILTELFNEIPYLQTDSRQALESFLGFHHHVTGTKEWFPAQKAEYIANLINRHRLNYEEASRIIGISTSKVQYYYIAHQLFLQMESYLEGFSVKKAEWRFTTLFSSLQTLGVQKYLGLDLLANPSNTRTPVPKNRLDALANFARWLFGSQQHTPLLSGSQNVADFGRLLENSQAIQYLENNKNARFDVAWRLAYGDEEIIQLIDEAHDKIKISLSYIERYKDSPEIQRAVEKLVINSKELLSQFPNIRAEFLED